MNLIKKFKDYFNTDDDVIEKIDERKIFVDAMTMLEGIGLYVSIIKADTNFIDRARAGRKLIDLWDVNDKDVDLTFDAWLDKKQIPEWAGKYGLDFEGMMFGIQFKRK